MDDKSRTKISALVVEDNRGDLALIEAYLAEKFEKFELINVETAQEAETKLLSFDKDELDIILLDLSLPDMSGEALIQKIVSVSNLTPVIILTGFSDLRFSIKSLSLGVSDYLIKDELTSALLQKSILYANERNVSFRKIKESEKELELLNRQLEEKVEERTRQLKIVNNELEAFSYSVSHDLRAPLRSIDGFSQAILEGYSDKLDETGIDYLNRVRKASQKLSHLIDQFLNLAKVTRTELHSTQVDLSSIVHSIMHTLKSGSTSRNVDLSIEVDLVDFADPSQIKIVLQNLLENSWKYTSKSEVPSICFGSSEKDGKRVYFVKDNGAGFNMKYSNKLFMPFQRLHHENDYPGTGIGLATVKRIIDRHNGEIWAEGEPGKGATFHFTLGMLKN